MKKPVLKVTAWALSAALLCTGVGFAAYAQNSNKGALDTAVTDNADTNTPSEESTVSSADLNEALSKDETVYVITDADGSVEQLIVSDWVKNPQSLSEICDRSELENIENVKTDAEYTLSSDGAQVWSANGEDLYYQGTIQKELPVDMSVSYKLDGQSIEGKDLAGKSGKVTIRFDYTNNQYEYVDLRSVCNDHRSCAGYRSLQQCERVKRKSFK
jgi:putative membrane protein